MGDEAGGIQGHPGPHTQTHTESLTHTQSLSHTVTHRHADTQTHTHILSHLSLPTERERESSVCL